MDTEKKEPRYIRGKYTQAQKEASMRYNAKAYDEIKLRVPKGEKANLQEFAAEHHTSESVLKAHVERIRVAVRKIFLQLRSQFKLYYRPHYVYHFSRGQIISVRKHRNSSRLLVIFTKLHPQLSHPVCTFQSELYTRGCMDAVVYAAMQRNKAPLHLRVGGVDYRVCLEPGYISLPDRKLRISSA